MRQGGFNMEITAKELRCKLGQIIEQAARGTKVVITIRGKKIARIIPYTSEKGNNSNELDFGQGRCLPRVGLCL
jgi:prevent-host-death family protein